MKTAIRFLIALSALVELAGCGGGGGSSGTATPSPVTAVAVPQTVSAVTAK